MISIRIICRFCGADNHCPIAITDYKKYKTYGCSNCEAHLFDVVDDEGKE